jgi:16S rRNA (guanine966-N2)-methyltransferase
MSARAPGRVRIVAGAKRGLLLKVPAGGVVRPTSEMVRGAVFNALGPIPGARALDLFAGTGAMGLEALSRGAAGCVFVEADRVVAALLRENIHALGYDHAARLIGADYRTAVDRLVQAGERFDLLFVDPPYRMLTEVEVTLSPRLPALLSADGVVVVEGERSSGVTFGMDILFDRVYGDTRVTMVSARRDIG